MDIFVDPTSIRSSLDTKTVTFFVLRLTQSSQTCASPLEKGKGKVKKKTIFKWTGAPLGGGGPKK